MQLREFARQRDWEQFHHPKNLAMALSAECGELVEIFQWLGDEESRDAHRDPEIVQRARDEIADVFIYLVRLADVLNVSIEAAATDKLARNAERYSVADSRGNALKRP
jgi:dCTP diphosphatase